MGDLVHENCLKLVGLPTPSLTDPDAPTTRSSLLMIGSVICGIPDPITSQKENDVLLQSVFIHFSLIVAVFFAILWLNTTQTYVEDIASFGGVTSFKKVENQPIKLQCTSVLQTDSWVLGWDRDILLLKDSGSAWV